eukprot:15353815-Alexandrium_andersonii.AAC.1
MGFPWLGGWRAEKVRAASTLIQRAVDGAKACPRCGADLLIEAPRASAPRRRACGQPASGSCPRSGT